MDLKEVRIYFNSSLAMLLV